MPRGGLSPGARHWHPLRPVCRLSRGLGILDEELGIVDEELGGGVIGRVPRPEALGDEGTEELPPPPDVAPGNVAPCDVEGGTWSGAPMPHAPMKSETSSKLVEIGAGGGDAGALPASEK